MQMNLVENQRQPEIIQRKKKYIQENNNTNFHLFLIRNNGGLKKMEWCIKSYKKGKQNQVLPTRVIYAMKILLKTKVK